jgi:hypothetical protein
VLPLHFRHPQEIGGEIGVAGEDRESRSFLVLAYVSALEASCAVHGSEPAAHPTKGPERRPNPPEERLPERSRTLSKVVEHPADAAPVLHLLTRDFENLRCFRCVGERSRVAQIGETRGELTRMRPS